MGRCDQACGKIRAGFRKNIWYFVILGGLAAVNLIAALAGYLVAFGVVIIAGTAFYLNRKKQHVPVKEQVEQSEKAYRDLLAEEEEKDARKKAKEERKKKRRAEAEERRRQDRERSSSGKKKKEKQRDIIREDDDDEDYLARLQAIREGKSMNKVSCLSVFLPCLFLP